MKFLTRFSDSLPRPTVQCTKEEGRAKPEFRDDCDINKILARYRTTGQLPASARSQASRYGDFSQIPDFMEMQERVLAATDMFMALPARIRKEFDNDPGLFLASAETKEGQERMEKLGLIQKPIPPAAVPAPGSGGEQPPAPKKGAPKKESGQDSE